MSWPKFRMYMNTIDWFPRQATTTRTRAQKKIAWLTRSEACAIIKTIKALLVRGKFVRKERRKNSTRQRLQTYRAIGEKLEN